MEPPAADAALPRPRQASLRRRLVAWGLGGIIALVAALAIALWAIDTDPGHRFLIDRIARLAPGSGLRIQIGRIEGSIFGTARIRDLRLSDQRGVFLQAPAIELDWTPSAWLANRLDITEIRSDLVILHRLPKLKPSGRERSILPGFDIRIGRLEIARLRIEPAVTGTRRIARVEGRADIRNGRALIDLRARAGGGDAIALMLDAAPDRDRFDLDARVTAPAGGVIGAMLGTKRPMALAIAGDGRWKDWKGAAKLDVSARRVMDLSLGVRSGAYSLSGVVTPASVLQGKLQRLTSPRVLVTGEATLVKRRLDTTLALRSAALSIDAGGVLDLGANAFEGLRVNAHLLRPPAMFPNMTGSGIRLTATFDGPFATAAYDYRLTGQRIAFDRTGFEYVRATGRGRLSRAPIRLPVSLAARRVTGVGDVAGGILANLAVDGVLAITPQTLRGDGLILKSDKLNGKLGIVLDLATGRYVVAVSGSLARYLIPGLGIVDVTSDLRVVPGPGGRGTTLSGRGRAWVRRLDNGFLRSLAGGLPDIDTGLMRGPDGIIRFTDLRLRGPGIAINGNGYRRTDGTFVFEGAGTQAQYGPLRLSLDGPITRPKIDLLLARPLPSAGLSAVRVALEPTPSGFAYRAGGGSTLGPFTSFGQILLPPGQPAIISIGELLVSGTRASGNLRADPGGFTGRLALAGGGVAGQLLLNPLGDIQRIEAHLTADSASFAGPPAITIRRGQLDLVALLDPAGASIEATASARGLRRGGLALGRLEATARLRGGKGDVTADFSGARGRAFDLKTAARIEPGRIAITGEGTVDRRPIRLTSPAVLTSQGGGWALANTGLRFNGGTATLGGRFGGDATELDATLSRMPLSVLDIAFPELALGGHGSGRVTYRTPAGGGAPSGRADLTIKGLTRSGLVLSSRPVDAGVTAVLDGRGAVARAVIQSGGQVIGRAQARLAPLGAGADIGSRLANAPLFAQLRYDGPADTLWRLTGIETIDLSGPIAVGADMTGRLADPRIRGSVRTSGGRLESAVTGTVIEKIEASGRFDGSRLVVDRFTGSTPRGGGVSGRASFDLAAANGFGIDIAITADNATLLNRDDIGANITGPLTIRSDGSGGVIAGDVQIIQGRFRLGQAAAASVPTLPVREINRRGEDEEAAARPVRPWQLDIKARARNRLAVTGLGLDSEWRADLAIEGQVDNPSITGRADLVRGGYEFAGRRFDLERGTIRFTGTVPADPVLDITAISSISGLNAQIRVTGTGQKPDIAFTSVPALPEDELLSRLLFGTSITNLSAPEALQLAAAVASLRNTGGGLNPINAVRRAAGLDRLRILPADVATGQRTTVAAGKYVTRRVYVEVATDGQGYSATRVEWQLTRWLSLLSSISTLGRTSANVRISKDY